MKKVPLYFLIVFLTFPTDVFASKIYLKGGGVVEGEIINRTENDVTIRVKGVLRKYYRAQYDWIEEDIKESEKDPLAKAIEEEQDISYTKAHLIVRLLEANGTKEKLTKNIEEVSRDVPPEQRAIIEDFFEVDGLISRFAVIYDKYYSEKELQKLIEFYESDIGKKSLEVTPQIMRETMQSSVEYFQDRMMQAAPTSL